MLISKATRDDLPRILEIQKACFAREAERVGDPDIPPMRQTLAELEGESNRSVILKGVENGIIIGTARASMEGSTCLIGRLAVLPEFRGGGRGSALVRAIEAEFPQSERYEIFTGSASLDTIRLYERLGYRQFAARPASADYCLVYLEKPGPASMKPLSLGIDFAGIGDYAAYRDFWKRLPRIEARMVEKNEECRHSLGESIVFENPYDRPAGICHALAHVFQLHLWRLSLGFPSWNGDDRSAYRLHCPDAAGTVWELRALPRGPAPEGRYTQVAERDTYNELPYSQRATAR
jgi:N-acetylglutamate synthase-like GNAT family acetyltransferase